MPLRAILIIALFFFSACKKEKNTTPTVVQGTIDLEVHATHHGIDVPAITIYLMRNATTFPGNDSSLYTFHGMADGYGKYTFENLFPGNYYVYASGYDSLWYKYVTGNIPITLETSTVNNNEAFIVLEVSE